MSGAVAPAAPATFLLEQKSEPVNGQRVIGLVIPPTPVSGHGQQNNAERLPYWQG